MTKPDDPLFAGLAEGLRPADLEAAAADKPTLSVTELAAMSIDHRFGRIADALEKLAKAAECIADAAPHIERIADSLETVAALFASVIGVGEAECCSDTLGRPTVVPVGFIRAGAGNDAFTCDADNQ
jgi:hypothetical protein